MRATLSLLVLLMAAGAEAIQYPVSYTFRSTSGNLASGTFLDDDISNPLHNFDRMSFRADTGTEFGVDGYFERVMDYHNVPGFTLSADATVMLVNGGISGRSHADPNPGFISFTADSITGLTTWLWTMFYDGREYSATGAGLWLRSDLPMPTTFENSSNPSVTVPDTGGTLALIAMAMGVVSVLSRWLSGGESLTGLEFGRPVYSAPLK